MTAPLSSVLKQVVATEWIGDPQNERFVTVRLHGNGAVERSIGPGKSPRPFRGVRVRAGQLVFSRIDARHGAFAIVPDSLDGAVVSKDFPVFDVAPEADAQYLLDLLTSEAFRSRVQGLSNGATNRQRVGESAVLSSRLHLPVLAEQLRISGLLMEASRVRESRREAIRKLDLLAEATYWATFGDMASNTRNWPRQRLGELGDVVTGNTPPRSDPKNYGKDLEWIKSDNILLGQTYVTAAAEMLSAQGRRIARTVPPGSVLVTCIAGSTTSIGNAALVDREVAFNQQINAFVPRVWSPIFALAQLRAAKRLVQDQSTGGMKGLVSKSKFAAIEFTVPPRDLEGRYVRFYEQLDGSRTAFNAQLARLDELYFSLQYRAFRGEL